MLSLIIMIYLYFLIPVEKVSRSNKIQNLYIIIVEITTTSDAYRIRFDLDDRAEAKANGWDKTYTSRLSIKMEIT